MQFVLKMWTVPFGRNIMMIKIITKVAISCRAGYCTAYKRSLVVESNTTKSSSKADRNNLLKLKEIIVMQKYEKYHNDTGSIDVIIKARITFGTASSCE